MLVDTRELLMFCGATALYYTVNKMDDNCKLAIPPDLYWRAHLDYFVTDVTDVTDVDDIEDSVRNALYDNISEDLC